MRVVWGVENDELTETKQPQADETERVSGFE